MSDEAQTARERAEANLTAGRKGSVGVHVGHGARRIGWSLLDIADAIRDLAGAVREHTAAARPSEVTHDPTLHDQPPFKPFAGGEQ